MTHLLAATTDGLHDLDAGTVDLVRADVGAVAATGDTLWALVDERSLWRRVDGWAEVAQVAGPATALGVGLDAVLVGSSPARLWRWDGAGLVALSSFERAPTVERWTTPWGGPPAVRSMTLTPSTWFVNVHVGGILRSDDAGVTWVPTLDLDADVHQVATGPDGSLLAATGAAGFARSVDGGATWEHDSAGLHGTYLRAVVAVGGSVLVSASTGPAGHHAALYRRPLAGLGFVQCTEGLPEWFQGNVDTGWLASDGTRAAVASPEGVVYESLDEGETWTAVADGLPSPRGLVYAP